MKLIFNRSVSVILSAVMLFVSALSLNGCGVKDNSQTLETATTIAETTQASDEPQQKRKIIIDTDTAGDDASALIIAAKAKNIDILGVTVSAGNVSLDQAVKNALMTLEMAGSDAPVYAGASTTYTGKERETFSVYGKDGMGDQDLIHPTRKAEDKGAVDFIVEAVKANPDEVEIVALGPVTNLALAFDKDPETMKRVKKYWSMGTAGFGPATQRLLRSSMFIMTPRRTRCWLIRVWRLRQSASICFLKKLLFPRKSLTSWRKKADCRNSSPRPSAD